MDLDGHARSRAEPTPAPGSPARVTFSGAWLIVAALLSVTTLVTVSLSRFLEWDEAVFFGQSGGYQGADAPAPSLAPSRELGPVVLIKVLRFFASDLAETRLLWAVVSVAAIVAAYRALEPHIGRASSVAACVMFGTSWIALIYAASFYASLLGAMFALLATAAYLTFREEPTWRQGVVVAAWFAAAFWMRQVESAIVLLVLVAHLIVSRQGRDLLREKWRVVAGSAAAFVLLFVVPWAIDATVRYGSVLGRLRAGQSQQYPRGFRNNLWEYGQLLLGSGHFRAQYPIAAWTRWSLVGVGVLAGLVLLTVLGMYLTGRWSRRLDGGISHVGLMFWLALASLSFFFFYGGVVRERYVLFGLAFGLVAVGQAAIALGRSNMRSLAPSTTVHGVGLALVLGLWLSVNQSVAQPLQAAREIQGRAGERIVAIVGSLNAGGSCRGLARYGAPTIQVGTGCPVAGGARSEAARDFAEDMRGGPQMAFVVWPSGVELDLPASWDVIEVPVDDRAQRLISVYYSRSG